MILRRIKRYMWRIALVWLAVGWLAARQVGPYGLAECNAALPGSAIEAAFASTGVPIVCEARPPGAPSYTTGEWDGSTARLWVAGQDVRIVRKVAAHELGHAVSTVQRYAAWAAARGVADTQRSHEDFAEMFSRVNFYEPGVGYTYYNGPLTPEQVGLMQGFWAGGPTEDNPPVAVADTAPGPAASAPLTELTQPPPAQPASKQSEIPASSTSSSALPALEPQPVEQPSLRAEPQPVLTMLKTLRPLLL